MKWIRFLLAIIVVASATIPILEAQQKPTFTTTRKWVTQPTHPKGGFVARFIPRDKMKGKQPLKAASFSKAPTIPTTTLPVDCTGGQKVVAPMDGNDSLGDCGMAMMNHSDNILTFGQGKAGWSESSSTLAALEKQYEQLSGGDNGMDEDMCVGSRGAWIVGLAGITGSWGTPAVVYESLDIDFTNVALVQYCIDQFYTVQMAWSVPDSFINGFTPGATYDAPVRPDSNNGHYTPLTDVAANGNYTLYTWGAYCFVTQKFVNQVEPSGFVAFGVRQFNPKTGYDSHGRHITTQNAAWVAIGGTSLPASVISAFPPIGPVPPSPPPPGPTPPGPTPPVPPTPGVTTTITLNNALAAGSYELAPLGSSAAIANAMAQLQAVSGGVAPAPPAPSPTTIEQRVVTLETAVGKIVTIVSDIQQALNGGKK